MNDHAIGLTRIRHHYPMLSNAEKRIADYIMEHYKTLGEATAQELANVTETSPATVVRFCRSVGFKGLADFKMYLKHEHTSPNARWFSVDSDESVSAIIQKTFAFNSNSAEETLSILDDSALEAAVEAIDKASQVVIVSEGGSASAARSAFDVFLQIGIPCVFIEDPFFQVLGIARLPKDAVVIGFNHSGQARNTVEAVRVAQEKGLTTIGLVGIVGSPFMKHVDIPLLTGISEHLYFSDSIAARICELNVVSALHAVLSIRRKEQLGDFREEVSNMLSIKRMKR